MCLKMLCICIHIHMCVSWEADRKTWGLFFERQSLLTHNRTRLCERCWKLMIRMFTVFTIMVFTILSMWTFIIIEKYISGLSNFSCCSNKWWGGAKGNLYDLILKKTCNSSRQEKRRVVRVCRKYVWLCQSRMFWMNVWIRVDHNDVRWIQDKLHLWGSHLYILST